MSEHKSDNNVSVKTGVEIILEFKDSINNIIHWYSLYINHLAKIEAKTSGDIENLKNLEESERAETINFCQELRYHTTVAYLKYKSLYPSLKLKENEKITETYSKIKNNFLIGQQDVEIIIIEFNKVVMENIILELMKNNEELIKNIFSRTTNAI